MNELEHATLLRLLIGTVEWPITRPAEERARITDEVRYAEIWNTLHMILSRRRLCICVGAILCDCMTLSIPRIARLRPDYLHSA